MEKSIVKNLSKQEILLVLLQTPPEKRTKSDLQDIAYLLYVNNFL